MKTWIKMISAILSLTLVMSLAACGSGSGEATTAAPADTTAAAEDTTAAEVAETEEEVTAIESGTYTFNYVDKYGDETEFTVTTKDTGKVFVTLNGQLGNSKIIHADTWSDNGDGTFTTGPLDADLDVEFLEADGSIIWALDGENVTPVNYTEPTTFEEKVNTAPTTKAEAVGIYTFGYVNAYGVTVPYVIWLNADGTASMFMVSAWAGTQRYDASEWSITEDSVVTIGGEITYEGEPPLTDGNGATWFDATTYESSWQLDGDGNAVPVGFDGDIGELTLPDDINDETVYPADAALTGVYVFGYNNAYGVTVPYIITLNPDGTALMCQVSAWVGNQFYLGHKVTVNDDGTVTISDVTFDGEAPLTEGNGATWYAEGTYESTWVLNDDGTCIPADYDGEAGEVDVTTLDAAVYPQ